jgi:hypothetical protein
MEFALVACGTAASLLRRYYLALARLLCAEFAARQSPMAQLALLWHDYSEGDRCLRAVIRRFYGSRFGS